MGFRVSSCRRAGFGGLGECTRFEVQELGLGPREITRKEKLQKSVDRAFLQPLWGRSKRLTCLLPLNLRPARSSRSKHPSIK